VVKCTSGSQSNTCPAGSTGTLYWRSAGGDTIAENTLSGANLEEYVFFNGARIARRDVSTNAVHYYFSDHLGTHAVVENATGSTCEQDIDYYPYGGQEHDYCPSVPQNYKFNGKEHDAESGLENFGARYDASTMGRFMTPDWAAKPTAVPYANFGNPQSLNLYSYVENNPTTMGDPDGHAPPGSDGPSVPCSGGSQACAMEWVHAADAWWKVDRNAKMAETKLDTKVPPPVDPDSNSSEKPAPSPPLVTAGEG
jgi:RHS repeat-associated protein